MITKLHDLSKLRREIKKNAEMARNLREQARATSHDERHSLKLDANGYAYSTRYALLAYGYLRGLSIREMESPFTHNLAVATAITNYAKPCFRKLVDETPEEYAAAWKDFYDHVQADVKSWNNECRLHRMQREAARIAREVA